MQPEAKMYVLTRSDVACIIDVVMHKCSDDMELIKTKNPSYDEIQKLAKESATNLFKAVDKFLNERSYLILRPEAEFHK